MRVRTQDRIAGLTQMGLCTPNHPGMEMVQEAQGEEEEEEAEVEEEEAMTEVEASRAEARTQLLHLQINSNPTSRHSTKQEDRNRRTPRMTRISLTPMQKASKPLGPRYQ